MVGVRGCPVGLRLVRWSHVSVVACVSVWEVCFSFAVDPWGYGFFSGRMFWGLGVWFAFAFFSSPSQNEANIDDRFLQKSIEQYVGS